MKPKLDGHYHQGYFNPEYPEKYKGQTPIICRSSLEFRFCEIVDKNTKIVKWSSESIKIKYWHPVDKQYRTYFPDYWLRVDYGEGETTEFVIEVKSVNDLYKPKEPKKVSKKVLENYKQKYYKFISNWAKIKQASDWAKKNGINFRIVTENELNRWVN